MADLDRIGPLKPALPPIKRRERQRRRDGDTGTTEPGPDDKPSDEPRSDGSTHQVDEYA